MVEPKLLRLAADLAEKLGTKYAEDIRFEIKSELDADHSIRVDTLYVRDQYDDHKIPVWEVTYNV